MCRVDFLPWLFSFLPLQLITGPLSVVLGLILLVVLLTLALLFLRKQQQNGEQTLQQQRKEKEEFCQRVLTTLTRDFRTPLTVINAASEQLSQQMAPSPTEVQLIRANSERLLHLVNRLQDRATNSRSLRDRILGMP